MDLIGTKLKVLHVASGDLWAGAEVQMFYLCRQMFRRDIDVQVVLFNQGVLARRLMQEGIAVTVFDESKCSSFQLLKKLMHHLRAAEPTLIHTHGYKENVLVGLANVLTTKAAAVRTAHGANEINEPLWKVHKHLFHLLDRFAGRYWQQAIIAVSHPLADLLSQTFDPQKICVIENAIDTDYVKQLADLPSSLTIDTNVSNVAVIGRLVSVKRQDLLLKALPLLRKHSMLRLYVIGEGPLANQLISLADELDISDKVTFVGALDPVYPTLAQMDALIMPSDHEGLPMTLLEAMTLGVPVVAHGVGGIITATRQGELATLVQDHSAQGYAHAIATVLADVYAANLRAKMAAEYVTQHYDIVSRYVDYLKLYNVLIQKKGFARV